MAETKNLKPETIPNQPFPGQGQSSGSNPASSGNLVPESISAGGFPIPVVASHLVSAMLNSMTGKILGNFSFGRLGAISIGRYVNGVSGDVRISPNGILGRNSAGVTTFSIDATTGNAAFLGTVYATAGSIGGFTIESSYLVAGSGSNTAGISPSDYPFWAGATYANRASAKFKVTPAGILTATDVDLTGKITASSGTIGGWAIGATSLTGGGVVLDSSGVVIVANGNDKVVLLADSGVGYVGFFAGGSLKGLLRGTTARSGGISVLGGDFVLDNNYAYLAQGTGSNYARFGVDNSNNTLLVSANDNIYFEKNDGGSLATLSTTAFNCNYIIQTQEHFMLKDGVIAPGTSSGNGRIYIDSADGDLKIKFGDGTVKTIVAD